MQLNIYIPKAKERLIEEIQRLARKKNRSKNELVVAALEVYLKENDMADTAFGVFDLGIGDGALERASLHEQRLGQV